MLYVTHTYASDDILNLLFMRFTFQDVSNLLKARVLLVTKGDDFIKGAQKFKGVRQNGWLRHGRSQGRDQPDDE